MTARSDIDAASCGPTNHLVKGARLRVERPGAVEGHERLPM